MDIGKRLKHLRDVSGLTQEEVGKLTGVTKATINRYETGEIDIKRTVAIKLAAVFNVSPAYIMGWTDNATTEKRKSPIDDNIKKYFKLNSIGKNKVGVYIDDLLCNPQYIDTDDTYEIAAYDMDETPVDEWQPPKTETTAD